MCPFHRQSLIVPDSRRVRIGLFKEGVGISSTEVAGEAILAVSTPETMGVVEAIGVMNGPFPVTRTPLFPMLDSGLSFLDLIFAYISLLNLVIISTRRKNLLKKKKIQMYTSSMLTLFSLDVDAAQDVGRRVKTKVIEGKGPRIYQIVPIFDHQGVFYRLLNTRLMPAFEFRLSLNCAKQEAKESVTITANTTKLKKMGRNTDAPKVGVPYQRSNLGISP